MKSAGRKARSAQAEFSSDAPHDGNSGAEHGFGQGHPGAPAAREGRHNGQRVYAGVAGEREEDGGSVYTMLMKGGESQQASEELLPNATNVAEELAVSI
jgi:hypothetical protein